MKMTYIFIASDPQNHEFTAKLSQDLQAEGLANWYSSATETEIYSQLQQATHIIAVLSPSVLLNENFLAALEYGKQNNLPRIPLRLVAIETFPPQLQGIIPIDFSKPEEYAESLQTLLGDLNLPNTQPVQTLPTDLLDHLHSDKVDERQNAILKLREFKSESDTLRNLARDELAALVFRERDPSLKALVATTLKLFDEIEDDTQPSLPSKETLVEQAEKAQMNVVIEDRPVQVVAAKKFLWQAPRWYFIMGALGIALSVIFFALTFEYAVAVPLIVVSVVLPHLNIELRQGGKYHWKPSSAIIGNIAIALILGIIIAGVFVLIGGLSLGYLAICAGGCAFYGLVVGGLSTVKV